MSSVLGKIYFIFIRFLSVSRTSVTTVNWWKIMKASQQIRLFIKTITVTAVARIWTITSQSPEQLSEDSNESLLMTIIISFISCFFQNPRLRLDNKRLPNVVLSFKLSLINAQPTLSCSDLLSFIIIIIIIKNYSGASVRAHCSLCWLCWIMVFKSDCFESIYKTVCCVLFSLKGAAWSLLLSTVTVAP